LKWNECPNWKIPIQFIKQIGNDFICKNIGWISTPNVQQLRHDVFRNKNLVGKGVKYEAVKE
jgi:hypothetical protein